MHRNEFNPVVSEPPQANGQMPSGFVNRSPPEYYSSIDTEDWAVEKLHV